jgi:hypothetical protein
MGRSGEGDWAAEETARVCGVRGAVVVEDEGMWELSAKEESMYRSSVGKRTGLDSLLPTARISRVGSADWRIAHFT